MTWFSPEYLAYIDSPQWQAVRARKLAEVGERCQNCHSWRYELDPPRILQVHHLNYDQPFGQERMSDLQVLCVPCHEKATRRMRRNRRIRRWLVS